MTYAEKKDTIIAAVFLVLFIAAVFILTIVV